MGDDAKKTISIDPELFKFPSGNGTRRKRPTSSPGEPTIRVRPPPKPRDHNKTTRRHALLKFIRRHQANNYQRIMEGGADPPVTTSLDLTPKNEIDETLEYLMGVADEVKKRETISRAPLHVSSSTTAPLQLKPLSSNPSLTSNPPSHQYTVRAQPRAHENVSMTFPDTTSTSTYEIPSHRIESSNIQLNHRPLVGGEHPKYGCLRGGNLPTYRQWQQQQPPSQPPRLPHPSLPAVIVPPSTPPTEEPRWPNRENYVFRQGGDVRPASSTSSHSTHPHQAPSQPRLKILRQRRTCRRTFNIGKSKKRAQVGVLISNRTIRKNIATKALQLKQVPMTEVRRYLVKHNLITVGSDAPDYILRKMYETSNTLCGEIYNHNNENLLHNFIHGKD